MVPTVCTPRGHYLWALASDEAENTTWKETVTSWAEDPGCEWKGEHWVPWLLTFRGQMVWWQASLKWQESTCKRESIQVRGGEGAAPFSSLGSGACLCLLRWQALPVLQAGTTGRFNHKGPVVLGSEIDKETTLCAPRRQILFLKWRLLLPSVCQILLLQWEAPLAGDLSGIFFFWQSLPCGLKGVNFSQPESCGLNV